MVYVCVCVDRWFMHKELTVAWERATSRYLKYTTLLVLFSDQHHVQLFVFVQYIDQTRNLDKHMP